MCPAPPLLARELTGQALVLPELRQACAAAVARLLATAPDVVLVVGAGAVTATWDPGDRLDLPAWAPGHGRRGTPGLPLAPGLGAMLLDEAGFAGPLIMQAVGEAEPAAACLRLGASAADLAGRVAMLVVGDGSARRSPTAPGHFDERAAPFDRAVQQALEDGDMTALAALDPVLARDLLASGRAAWQVLAGALSPLSPRGEILYADAPLGVSYLVAVLGLGGLDLKCALSRKLASMKDVAICDELSFSDLPALMAEMSGDSKHDHSAASTLDVLWVLYDQVLRVSPDSAADDDRDRFLLSKGHAPKAFYAVLAAKGFIDRAELHRFGTFCSILGHHPDRTLITGVEIASGSLGHGLPIGVGLALGLRARGLQTARVFVLVGDGELDEGSNHEAIAFAGAVGLDRLTVIVVDNSSSTYGWPGGAQTRFSQERWSAARVSGRDHAALAAALRAPHPGTPHVIVAVIDPAK